MLLFVAKSRVAAVMNVGARAWLRGAALPGRGQENDVPGNDAGSWSIVDGQQKPDSIT